MKDSRYLIVLIGVLLIGIGIAFFGEKSLDPKSSQITELYKNLGTLDLNLCGGLNTYDSKEVKKEDISLENRLCLAYNFLNDEDIMEETAKVSNSKNSLCEISDEIFFAPLDNTKECNYTKISKDNLNKAYIKIYGDAIANYLTFNYDDSHVCYLKDDFYYCGLGETINATLFPDTTILRIKDKALKNLHGDIIIEDYFLRIVNNKCYTSNGLGEENTKCSTALSEYEDFSKESDEVKTEFLKTYGQKYRHVFKKNNNDEYYWYKSYQK